MRWFFILSQPSGLLDEGEASEAHGRSFRGHFQHHETVMDLPGIVAVLKKKYEIGDNIIFRNLRFDSKQRLQSPRVDCPGFGDRPARF